MHRMKELDAFFVSADLHRFVGAVHDAAPAAFPDGLVLSNGHRRAFSHYMLGRMMQGYDPAQAQQHYQSAMSYLAVTPGTELHRAFVATQTAAYAVSLGEGQTALRQIEPHIDNAARAENAALLATLMLLKAEALDLMGRSDEGVDMLRIDCTLQFFGSKWPHLF